MDGERPAARPSRRLVLKWSVLAGAGVVGLWAWRWSRRGALGALADPGHAFDALLKARLDAAELATTPAGGCEIVRPLRWERDGDVADLARLRVSGHVCNRGPAPAGVTLLCALAAADASPLAMGRWRSDAIAPGATVPFTVENLLLPTRDAARVARWQLVLRPPA